MTISELDRLHDRLEKLFQILDEKEKRLAIAELKLGAHLDVSEIRVKTYDSDIAFIKKEIESLRKAIKLNEDFRKAHEAKESGIGSFLKWTGWVLAIALTIGNIWGLFVKISGN